MFFRFNALFLLLLGTSVCSDDIIKKLSDIEWLCADINCSEPIATGTPKIRYPSDHKVKVGFNIHEDIKIYGKPSDKSEAYWIISAKNKFGVAPHSSIKEVKVLKNPAACIKTKFNFEQLLSSSLAAKQESLVKINPSPTQEVIDGTTLNFGGESIEDGITVGADDAKETVNVEPSLNGEQVASNSANADKKNHEFGSLNQSSSYEIVGVINEVSKSPAKIPGDNEPSSPAVSETLVPDLLEESKTELSNITGYAEGNSNFLPAPDYETQLDDPGSTPNEGVIPKESQPRSKSDIDSFETEPFLNQTQDVSDGDQDSQLTQALKADVSQSESITTSMNEAGAVDEVDTVVINNSAATSGSTNTEQSPSDKIHKTQESLTETTNISGLTANISSSISDLPGLGSLTNQLLINNVPFEPYVPDPPESPLTSFPPPESLSSALETPNVTDYVEFNSKSHPTSNDGTSASVPQQKVNGALEEIQLPVTSGSDTSQISSNSGISSESATDAPFINSSNESTSNIQPPVNDPIASGSEKLLISSSLENPALTPISPGSISLESVTEAPLINSSNESPLPYHPVQFVTQPGATPNEIEVTPEKIQPSVNDPMASGSEKLLIPSTLENPDLAPTFTGSISLESGTISPLMNPSDESVVPFHPSEGSTTFFETLNLSSENTSGETSPEISSSFPLSQPSLSQDVTTPKLIEETDLSPDQNFKEFNSPDLTTIAPPSSAEESVPEEKSHDSPSHTPVENVDQVQENFEDSPTNWWSSVSSVIDSFKEMFSKSDIGIDDSQTIKELENINFQAPLSSQDNENEIQETLQSLKNDDFCEELPPGLITIPGFEGVNVSGSTLIYVILTSTIILLFSLGYYYLENLQRDSELVSKINSLSAELFFAQKELSTLEEQMSQTSENFQKLANCTTINEEELAKIKHDLEENKSSKEHLELEVKRLEKELEELVESNDEMHKMLTESITEEDRTQTLLANIADLKAVLSDTYLEISNITDQLDKEKQQVELLTIALQKAEEQKGSVEEKLQVVLSEVDSKALAVSKEFEEKVTSLEKIIEESSLERTNFEKELCELKAQCEKLSAEKDLSEKALKKAQGVAPGQALSDWLDSKEIRVELVISQKEIEKLKRELEEAREHESKLQEQKNELQVEVDTLINNYENAEKDKIEALTKLQVLSNYFKEKETQLQEELGEKESLWLQKQSEGHTIYEQMRSLREENLSYKAQNEALKKEILDQEASFKIQLANEEKKSQDHWVTLRHTERRLKEAQMEAAHLRNRLTVVETNSDSMEDKHKSLEMVNGDVGLGPGSPPFMLYPPPPPDFIPPPPLVSPSRPPPLGRLSSPPLTPPPPLSPYDLFPHPPTAPSPPNLPPRGIVKPLPSREPLLPPHRKQKESLSSTHSSESMEKPIRRGKR